MTRLTRSFFSPLLTTLSLALAVQASTSLPLKGGESAGSPASPLIPQYGRYSSEYEGGWTTLRTGKELAIHNPAAIPFQEVTGEEVRKEWHNQDKVTLKDLHYKIHWESPAASKQKTTLFYIENVKEVEIDNLSIVQTNKDYIGYHDILIEGADRVRIRNLYLAGPLESYHIRVEGCRDVFIENVEVAGVDFDGRGLKRTGGGIWINNGATGNGGVNNTGSFAKHPRVPGWQVVQNCYFHDATDYDGKWRNLDAVLIHSAGDGLLFNCVVENWLRDSADASFDLSFRRSDPEYQNRFFRVERNVLRNCSHFKTVGKSGPENAFLIANNLFVNTQIADYHTTFQVTYAHNTFIDDAEKAGIFQDPVRNRALRGFMCLWRFQGPTRLVNNLIFSRQPSFFMIYSDNQGSPEKYLQVRPDHNLYAVAEKGVTWHRSRRPGYNLPTFDAWKARTSQDAASKVIEPDPGLFDDYIYEGYHPGGESWTGLSSREFLDSKDPKTRIDRDFEGRPRTEANLVPGAFEPGSGS